MHSQLAQKPEDWFFMRHGKRVLKNSRFLLDFRNPAVVAYLDQVIARLVNEYGVGYIKMDYNVDALQGTELNADSFGQGLLEHNRAHLAWLDRILDRYPDLVIENCGSGGGRMDYAMLSRLQLQSATDQEDYLKLPAILTGVSAAVLPEQLACWSYPLESADADQASFNMVTAMICRIHQSGRLDTISPAARAQVNEGIRIYKRRCASMFLRPCRSTRWWLPDITNNRQPIAVGDEVPILYRMAPCRAVRPGSCRASTEARLYQTDLP